MSESTMGLFLVFAAPALVMLLESFSPRRQTGGVNLTRWANNLALGVLNQILTPRFVPLLVGGLSSFITKDAGLLARFGFGFSSSLVVTFLVVEYIGYWIHRINHKVPLLWRIHAVHHSDVNVDATTTFRHHPFEYILAALVNLPIIFFLGPEGSVLFIYGLVAAFVEAFSHGNLNLGRLDRWLSYFIVTPGFHVVHHSADIKFTDSNFSNSFPWFDYIHRTFIRWSVDQQAQMPLGLKSFRGRRDTMIDRLLLQPFLSKPA